jgi:hypothetical protein
VETLLAEVQQVFPVDSLTSVLKKSDELVLWLEGELQAIPIGFLLTADSSARRRFLFERVRSMRTIVSPLLDRWMQEDDNNLLDPQPEVISVSWFDQNTAAEQRTEYKLQELFAKLAESHSAMTWKTAGRNLEAQGRHDVLARTISRSRSSDKRVAMLAVCGHGCDEPHGLNLEDGIWNGSEVWLAATGADGPFWSVSGACELGNVDFLLLLSCSVGRLSHSRERDLTGFCTEVFVNRARSVLAGRWPLHSYATIEFVDHVAEIYLKSYLRLSQQGISVSATKIRGRSVAIARKKWAQNFRRNRAAIGLYGVAALELFGRS